MEQNKQILLLIIFVSSLLLSSFSAEAVCFPRNATPHIRVRSRHPSRRSPLRVASLSRRPSGQSPPHPHVPSLLQSLAAASPTPISPALKAICNKTDYPALCIASLAHFVLPNMDSPAAFLEVAIRVSVNYTEAALAKAKRLSSDPSISSTAKACISDCQDLYTDAVDSFNVAASAISTGDIGSMNSMLSGAISNFETCEDGFREMSEESPFKKIELKLSHMASNCLAIVALLR